MESNRSPSGEWTSRTFGEGSLSLAFTRRLVVVAPRRPYPYLPSEWADALVLIDQGEIEVECLGGTRQRFGPGQILVLEDLPLVAIHTPGPGAAVLVAVSRRSAPAPRRVDDMNQHPLEGTEWEVTAVEGAKVDAAARNSVRFNEGRVVGQVGVNRFSGNCEMADGRLTVGPIMSTMMAGPEPMMKLEQSFLGALEGEHPFWIDGPNLFIGSVTDGLALRRLGPAPITGTVMYRERMALPPGSIVTVELVDVSRADGDAEVLATTEIDDMVAPPFDFTLQPPDGPGGSYAVRARINGPDAQRMWATDSDTEPPEDDSPLTLMCVRTTTS